MEKSMSFCENLSSKAKNMIRRVLLDLFFVDLFQRVVSIHTTYACIVKLQQSLMFNVETNLTL